MIKIVNFQHTKKSKISGAPKTLCIFEDAENRRFSFMMKKAQTEIMGLVIIIVLIIMIIAFVTKLVVFDETVDYKKQFTNAQITSNMISTLLKTTSRDCNGLSMTELLQDCSQDQDVICADDRDSCDYFIEATQQIFGETLEKWDIDYEFKVFFEEESPIFTLGESCFGDKKSKLFPIPTDSEILSVKLDVCG